MTPRPPIEIVTVLARELSGASLGHRRRVFFLKNPGS